MNTELTQEQQRVDQVVQLVRKHIESVEQEVGLLKEDVVDIRKHFWDDVTVNDEHPDDITETFISMKQQAEVLSQRERSHRHGFQQLAVLRKLQDSCYFGRIDFSEESTSAIDSIYIGLASLMDDSGTQFLIYDWRAPVSSLYYDYPPGQHTTQHLVVLLRVKYIRNANISFGAASFRRCSIRVLPLVMICYSRC